MSAWIGQNYDLIRGLHIIAVIAWMAGMLYLPRLYVYHAGASPGSDLDQTFQTMEAKLLKIIINPAMIATFLLGAALLLKRGQDHGPGFFLQAWVQVKLGGALFLGAWHGFLAGARKRFAKGTNQRTARFWRMTNELPFLAAVLMVLAVTLEFGAR